MDSISIEKINLNKSEDMVDVVSNISQSFQQAVNASYPDVDFKVSVLPSNQERSKSDFQCACAMQMAGILKKKTGSKVNPREVAGKIMENLPQNKLIKSTEIAGPGFINIFVNYQDFLKTQIANLVVNGVSIDKSGHKGRLVFMMS